jgi:hypothetical protein
MKFDSSCREWHGLFAGLSAELPYPSTQVVPWQLSLGTLAGCLVDGAAKTLNSINDDFIFSRDTQHANQFFVSLRLDFVMASKGVIACYVTGIRRERLPRCLRSRH